jgi:hypothetical protein
VAKTTQSGIQAQLSQVTDREGSRRQGQQGRKPIKDHSHGYFNGSRQWNNIPDPGCVKKKLGLRPFLKVVSFSGDGNYI